MMFMNRVGEVTPRGFVFGVIIFTILIMGGVGIMGLWNDAGGGFTTGDSFMNFNNSFNKMNDVVDAGDKFKSSIDGTNPDRGVLGMLDGLINAVWTTIKGIFGTFEFVTDGFKGLSMVFGIPTWAVTLLTTLVVVMFAFSIYSLIFQGKV